MTKKNGKATPAAVEAEVITTMGNLATNPEPTVEAPTPIPAQDTNTQEEKAAKIKLTWEQATQLIAKEGVEIKISQRPAIKASLGAVVENIIIPGYNDGAEKVRFSNKFGIKWNTAEKALEAKRETVGRVVTVSTGERNHYIVLVVKDGASVKVVDRLGKEVEVTKANTAQFIQGGTCHGRVYKKARHIAYQYGLAHEGMEDGKYCRSNRDNLNLYQTPDDNKWHIYTEKGNARDLVGTPEEFLEDLINGGKQWEIIKG